MPGFITRESIDEVTARTDIVRLIGEYVPLTQRGSEWMACCPFHHEKTPSFHVSEDRKLYHCFGCGVGGTAITFVQQMEKLSFPQAIEYLAKREGIQLHYETNGASAVQEDPNEKRKAEYIDLYTRVATSFHYFLMETESGRFALEYILGRGITRETLEQFKLGYAPADRKWLRQFLLKKNYSPEFLDGSGLFSKKHPDSAFFSDRLMFPICNRRGETVAMGGRFLRGDKEHSPKYLNSGDLLQFKKGNTLYAFHLARQAMREQKRVIFCEGYMDCIAYHQCGIRYAVAPLGTALTEEQVKLVKPFVETILLSFDSDGAGQNATKKAILLCRRQDITVKVIRLTGGKDPAEIMQKFGAEYLTNEIEHAILDSDYLLNRLLEVYPKESPEGKKKASLAFFAYIDALQSDVQKNACLEQLCQTYEINLEAARRDFTNRKQLSTRFEQKETAAPVEQTIKLTAELRAVLTAATDDVSLFHKMSAEVAATDLQDPEARKLFSIMDECSRAGTFSLSSILNRCDSETLKRLILQSTAEFSAHAEQSVQDSILLIKRNVLEQKSADIQERISMLERSSLPEDRQQLSALLNQKWELDKQKSSLKG